MSRLYWTAARIGLWAIARWYVCLAMFGYEVFNCMAAAQAGSGFWMTDHAMFASLWAVFFAGAWDEALL